jgi:uncharacterized 2Fe-2S/4Fe-4S cluster protein (DUF4445 family)
MSNVLNFPKNNNNDIFPSNLDESYTHIEQVRRNFCDEVSGDVMEAVFSVINNYGIHVDVDEETVKNIVFMEESIKSLLYKMKKVQHPFHEIANTSISLNDDAIKYIEEKN